MPATTTYDAIPPLRPAQAAGDAGGSQSSILACSYANGRSAYRSVTTSDSVDLEASGQTPAGSKKVEYALGLDPLDEDPLKSVYRNCRPSFVAMARVGFQSKSPQPDHAYDSSATSKPREHVRSSRPRAR